MRQDIARLDALYDQTVDNELDMQAYIVAGDEYIEHAKSTTLPKMISEAELEEGTQGQLAQQKVFDYTQALDRFERVVHDLKTSYLIGIQMLPQIRVVQSASTTLIDKLGNSLDMAIPVWKNQMALALSLSRQQDALKLQQEISNTTNSLLKKNAEMLKTNALEVEKENQRSIVDVETLAHVNTELVATISGVLSIQEEGRSKRKEVEQTMTQLEHDLRDSLKELGADSTLEGV